MSPTDAFQSRVRTFNQPMVGVMAAYSRQHEIPIELLRERGLKINLVQDLSVARYFSPWELLAALGHSDKSVLSLELSHARSVSKQ